MGRMTASDLELVSTADLLNEAMGRFDHSGFFGLRIISGEEGDIGRHNILRQWCGNSHTCAGLAVDLEGSILNDLWESEEDSKDNPAEDEDE